MIRMHPYPRRIPRGPLRRVAPAAPHYCARAAARPK
jgi:hypothetical protein